MISKVLLSSLVLAMMTCLSTSAFSATNSTKIGISVVIKATERCDFSYSLNNAKTNQPISADCDDTANSLEKFEKSAAVITSKTERSGENFLRVVKTAQ